MPTTTPKKSKANPRSTDPNTLSNILDFVTTATSLNYGLSFEKRALEGDVLHEMRCVSEEGYAEVWLDSSFVVVKAVEVDGEELGELGGEVEKPEGKQAAGEVDDNEVAGWKLEERVKPYGSRLRILLGRKVDKDETLTVKIGFRTTEECTALGWMDPEQTSNKEQPYMCMSCPPPRLVFFFILSCHHFFFFFFIYSEKKKQKKLTGLLDSQCQAIHCRSLFPCQDAPAVKATYHSTIRSPLPVVVSGLSTSTKSMGEGVMEYEFEQKIPIPSYLYAVASGDITSAKIGPRSSLWTGPDELERCKKELENDTEKFIQAAENIIYPYPWETYNVLVLPPSFPYGAMENPNMTFATPTIIAGVGFDSSFTCEMEN